MYRKMCLYCNIMKDVASRLQWSSMSGKVRYTGDPRLVMAQYFVIFL